ncbi:DUF5357 family protein [Oscillatoria acuminata]|uniref:DUF5357 domain-containing protein n=1 Tax=Oscillatoria acuminata PCC 6304 TaxID=56110 RepID=K9TDM5_9CYAN|nr:DUF5357 family protein [Oscillatoria acuminata]AFY80231.1 hypothetical protein Oscil6304_0484 [Oscillatoria acuminata PCC 6304]
MLKYFIDRLRPPRPCCWETFILLSIFSWLLSAFSWLLVPPAENAYHFTHTGGLIFFVLGTAWWQWERPIKLFGIKIGPWIVGLLISIILLDDLPENWRHQAMMVTWPLLAAAVRSVPKFFRGQLLPSWPPISIRKELTVMFLFHVLISLWLQFGFLMNQWLKEYPSLLGEDFTRSSFAIAPGIEAPEIPQGNIMINEMETFLREQIEGQQWPRANQVISGLLENRISIDEAVKNNLGELEEHQWWQLRGTMIQRQGGYNITLFAIFEGVPLTVEKYYLEKSCEISQSFGQAGPGSSRPPAEALERAMVECGPASDRQSGPIPFQGQGFD